MCGFVALLSPGETFPDPLLDAMGEDIRHRGPDAGGRLSEPGVALVFRRLSILDPQARSDQPMSDASGRYTLVYNGEIYNYRALRRSLEAEGVRFTTSGDTEVVLRGYMHWGAALLDRLEGMFAFVVVDRREGLALAARDPFGIKPLHLLRRGRGACFASEMRPLTRLHRAEADEAALAELLTFGFAGGSLGNLRGIERVPGGTAVEVRLDDGSIRERRYADVLDTLRPAAGPGPTAAEAAEAVNGALAASVRDHLASDVGYALELSGGVDSSLVAALASSDAGEAPASFGIRLDDLALDEGEHRAQVVDRYHLQHHEVNLTGRDFAAALPRAVRHMEGPVPHGGCVMLMLLCERIREASKVVLTGEGADELFGGYHRYAEWRKLALQERVGRLLPAPLWPPVRPFAGVRRLAGLDAAAYASVNGDFRATHRLFPGLVPAPGARGRASARFTEFRDRMLAVDQNVYLESLLMRQDRMSMAASVEARVPFVHRPLLAIANALPRPVRVPGGVTKPVLKAVADRYLPASLVHRRKNGLRLPYDAWLGDARAAGGYLDLLDGGDSRLAAYTDRGALARVVSDYRAGRRASHPPMFGLVNVELWLRSLDDAPEPAATPRARAADGPTVLSH